MLTWLEPIVLEGPSEAAKTAILIYMPGALVPAEKYVSMMKMLQDYLLQNKVSLTCLVIRYPKIFGLDMPPFWNPEKMVSEGLQYINYDDNRRTDPLFIGGHSLGAILSQGVTFKEDSLFDYAGLMLHSGFIMDKYRSTLPNIPTLSLSGTRDGMNRLMALAYQFDDFANLEGFREVAPTVLIEGMNHMQLAENYENSYTSKRDLAPTISYESAMKATVEYTSLFLLDQMTRVDTGSMKKAIRMAEVSYFRPYLDAYKADQTGATCVTAQTIHLEGDASSMTIESDPPFMERKSLLKFALSTPPEHNPDEKRITVQAYVSKAFTVFGRSSVPQSYQALTCKLLSKEKIFGTPSKIKECFAINKMIYEEVMSGLPGRVKKEYGVSPNRWVFQGDDAVVDDGGGVFGRFQWILSANLEIDPMDDDGKNGRSVRFPRYTSTPDGHVYCGLLSRSRIVEHAMIDSHRIPPVEGPQGNEL